MGVLGDDQIRVFARDGYLLLRGAVSEPLLVAAGDEIDRLVVDDPKSGPLPEGAGGASWFVPPAAYPGCEALLTRSGLSDFAAELVDPLPIALAFDDLQVSTTLPPWSHIPGAPHLDGQVPGADDAPPATFTMLAGVALTDQRLPQSGCVWVWPGSHLRHQDLFRSRGPRGLQPVFGHECYLDEPLNLGPGTELQMNRGDALLAHYLLGHNTGGNVQPSIRRTVYFRLAAEGHAARWESTMLDAWTEYPRVARVASA